VTERVNPFANLADVPVFQPKPRRENPVANDAIDRIAEENNFPRRRVLRTPNEAKRKRRVYTTGRNRQLNIKATSQTVERFYKIADERKTPLGALLEQALDALEKQSGP
jgi:hypothetical protein